MKKKLTIALLLAVCAFSLVLFTACGDKPTEVIPAGHTHEYAETVTKAATCTTAGEKTFKCACGDGYTSPIPALGHDFTGDGTKVVAPTCTVAGYTEHACKREGCGFTEKVDVVKATGHDYKVTTVPATCTEDGYIDRECANCGDKLEREIILHKGHEYEEVVGSRIEPTCHSEGSYKEKCKHCGDEKTTGIAKTEHNVDYVTDEEPTCTTAGRKHGACQNEGCNYTTVDEVIPALGHDWDGGTERTSPIGTTYIDKECSRCHEHDYSEFTDPEEPGEPSGSGEDK